MDEVEVGDHEEAWVHVSVCLAVNDPSVPDVAVDPGTNPNVTIGETNVCPLGADVFCVPDGDVDADPSPTVDVDFVSPVEVDTDPHVDVNDDAIVEDCNELFPDTCPL